MSTITGLARASAAYGNTFGWPTAIVDDRLVLLLTGDRAGIVLSSARGCQVVHWLRGQDILGQVVGLPGARRWVFLTDLNGSVPAQDGAPAGARYLRSPQTVPLPPTSTGDGRARWVVAPEPYRRWLPTFAAVLCAIRVTAKR